MKKYEENISDNSTWITAAPAPITKTLPFYIKEAGHFFAGGNYGIKRETYDSFLLLYTINGEGDVKTGDSLIHLPREKAVVIDCRSPHEYKTAGDNWEFLWIHPCGSGAMAMFDLIYPNGAVRALDMKKKPRFGDELRSLVERAGSFDVAGCIRISSDLHAVFNELCIAAMQKENSTPQISEDIERAVMFIEKNYAKPITVDDMTQNIHITKYHFIRLFHRAMGTTPYSYLVAFRISTAKNMLVSGNKSISEIAQLCGFSDTANFILHFRRRTGQTPARYRRSFFQ